MKTLLGDVLYSITSDGEHDQLRADAMRTETELSELVLQGLELGLVSSTAAKSYHHNGFHPAKALALLTDTSLEMEAQFKYWEHVEIGLELLRTPDRGLLRRFANKLSPKKELAL